MSTCATELLTERLLASAADLRVHRGGFPAGRLLHPGQTVPGEDPPAAAGGKHLHNALLFVANLLQGATTASLSAHHVLLLADNNFVVFLLRVLQSEQLHIFDLIFT